MPLGSFRSLHPGIAKKGVMPGQDKRKLLNMVAGVNKGWVLVLLPVFASMMLTSCGGGMDRLDERQAANGLTQPQPAQQKSASLYSQRAHVVAPSLSDEFKDGFNPSIWNNRSWYECNCGRHSDVPSRSTPWTFTN